MANRKTCLLYTSDAADEEDSVDLGGHHIIKKKKSVIDKNNFIPKIFIIYSTQIVRIINDEAKHEFIRLSIH